jgi:hypothetical protein
MKPFNPISNSSTVNPSRSTGLGDTVAKVANKLGFKKTEGCGCQKRQEILNKLVPYGKKGTK